MDLLSLVTSGVNDNEVCGPDEDILGVVEGWQDDETHNPDVPAVSHKRGLTPFVFVPFEEVCVFLLFHFTFCNQIPLWPRQVFINPLLKAKKCSHHMLSCFRTFVVKCLVFAFVVMQVETSFLNLPVEKMDYFVPG